LANGSLLHDRRLEHEGVPYGPTIRRPLAVQGKRRGVHACATVPAERGLVSEEERCRRFEKSDVSRSDSRQRSYQSACTAPRKYAVPWIADGYQRRTRQNVAQRSQALADWQSDLSESTSSTSQPRPDGSWCSDWPALPCRSNVRAPSLLRTGAHCSNMDVRSASSGLCLSERRWVLQRELWISRLPR